MSMSISNTALSVVLELHSLSLHDIPHEETVSVISLPYDYRYHVRLVTLVIGDVVYVYRVEIHMMGGALTHLLCTTPLYGDDTRP